jgi:ribosomal protein L40E
LSLLGFKNSERASFCRSCGADLQTISDILEGRIPKAIATKLLVKKAEDRIGRRTEFLRLNSISPFIWAVAALGIHIHSEGKQFSTPVLIPIMAFFLAFFVVSYLVFRRSKALYASYGKGQRQAAIPVELFCPSCGAQGGFKASHCSSCGQSLEAVAQALPAQPTKLTRWLDRSLSRDDRKFAPLDPRYQIQGLLQIVWVLFGLLFIPLRLDSLLHGDRLDFFLWQLFAAPYWLFFLQTVILRKGERALRGATSVTGHPITTSNLQSLPDALGPQPSQVVDDLSENTTHPLIQPVEGRADIT